MRRGFFALPARLIAAAGLSLIAVACSAGDPAEKAQAALQKAEEKIATGEYNAAVIHLKNAVQAQPDNAQARLKLGQVYAKTFQLAAAEKELQRALEEGAAPNQVFPFLLPTLNHMDKHSDVLTLSSQVPPELAGESWLIADQAGALIGLNRLDQADALLDGAADPGAAPILARHAQLAGVRRDYLAAVALADQAIAADADSFNAHLFQAQALAGQEKPEEALAAFSRAAEIEPYRPEALVGQVALNLQLGQIEAAASALDLIDKRRLTSPTSAHMRSVVALQQREFEEAKSIAERLAANYPEFTPAFYVAGIANAALGNDQLAVSYLEKFSGSGATAPLAMKALAWSNMKLGRAAEALRMLEVDGLSEDLDELRLATAAALATQDYDKAEEYLQEIIARTPEDTRPAAGLAALRLMTGDEEGAQEILDALQGGGLPESADDQIRLALVQLRAGNLDKVIEIADEIKKGEDGKGAGHTLAGLALAAQENYDRAQGELEQALDLNEGNLTASFALAAVHQRKEDPAAAERVLMDALEENPENLQLLTSIARLNVEQGDTEQAKAALREAVNDHPRAVEPKIVLARFLLAQGELEEALAMARRAEKQAPARPEVLETLASIQLQSGNAERASELFERLVDLRPGVARLHFQLAQAYTGAGERANAITSLKRVLDLNSEQQPARLALARLLLLEERLDEAAEQVEELRQALPEQPEVLEVAGILAAGQDRDDEAVELYKQAYAADPAPGRALGLARAQWRARKAGEAIDTLETAVEAGAPAGLHLELAQYYYQTGRLNAAIAQFEEIEDDVEGNPIFHNDFAFTLWEMGQLDRALEHAQRAYELAPDVAQIQDTLGVILLDKGQAGRAVELLRKASEQLPGELNTKYHLAKALAATGQRAEARTLLEDISRVSSFQKADEARQLLIELDS